MRIAGIIAEYDPFHTGHGLLIQAVRRAGADAVVAVMGGNWMQRGEPALFPKEVRAKAALRSGVDLVLELPLPYAAATAERFSFGGVRLLLALGCVDLLAFGSECGRLEPLQECAAALADPRLDEEIRRRLGEGFSYAAARQQGVEALAGPDTAALLSRPNDTLAVQYLWELAKVEKSGKRPQPFTIPRQGAGHNSSQPCPREERTDTSGIPRQGAGHHSDGPSDHREGAAATASASWLRERLLAGEREEIAPFLTAGSREEVFSAMENGRWIDPDRLELPLLSALRRMDAAGFAGLPDVSEGLEHRLAAAVRSSSTLGELLDGAVTKRYPRARLRRVLLSAYLGIPKNAAFIPPPYLRVLGIGPNGERILAKAKKTASLPVSHSLAKLARAGGTAAAMAALESRSTDLYSLLLREPRPCGTDHQLPMIRTEG